LSVWTRTSKSSEKLSETFQGYGSANFAKEFQKFLSDLEFDSKQFFEGLEFISAKEF
jgi:hypothetical protein